MNDIKRYSISNIKIKIHDELFNLVMDEDESGDICKYADVSILIAQLQAKCCELSKWRELANANIDLNVIIQKRADKAEAELVAIRERIFELENTNSAQKFLLANERVYVAALDAILKLKLQAIHCMDAELTRLREQEPTYLVWDKWEASWGVVDEDAYTKAVKKDAENCMKLYAEPKPAQIPAELVE